MTKWSEIKQATLHKLFLDEQEARQHEYLDKFQYLANECLSVIANGVKPKIEMYSITTDETNEVVTMPKDFLSFADMVGYVNGEPYVDIKFIADKKVCLVDVGEYQLFYNARWSTITEANIRDNDIMDIDESVLDCLPTYMASQLLAQDDMTRSATLKNEFEIMLARLDTNIFYTQEDVINTTGW